MRVAMDDFAPVLLQGEIGRRGVLIDDGQRRLVLGDQSCVFGRHLVVKRDQHGWLKLVVDELE
jgi:hypothetical protein